MLSQFEKMLIIDRIIAICLFVRANAKNRILSNTELKQHVVGARRASAHEFEAGIGSENELIDAKGNSGFGWYEPVRESLALRKTTDKGFRAALVSKSSMIIHWSLIIRL